MKQGLLVVTLIVLAGFPRMATAHSGFWSEFRKTYIRADDAALAKFYGSKQKAEAFTAWALKTSQQGSCKICHLVKKTDRNSFGQTLSAHLRANGLKQALEEVPDDERAAWIKKAVRKSSPEYSKTIAAFQQSLEKVLKMPSEFDADGKRIKDSQSYAERIREGLHPAPEIEKKRGD